MKTSVFVLVDALGWELIRDRDFLRDILPFQSELQTIFGFSSGAIPSILTGLRPQDHGHWNLFVYDPQTSPFRWARFLRLFPSGWINTRGVRKIVSMVSRKLSGTRGYFQIYGVPTEFLPMFDVCEKDDIYSPGGLSPNRSIFDVLQQHGVPYRSYSYHQFRDEQAVEQSARDIRDRKAQFYFIYLAELDEFLHYHIKDTPRVGAQILLYARFIRRIYEAAVAADPSASFYVFSDHGMTNVNETFDLMGVVESLGWKVPEHYLALYDSTMARFWFFHPQARAGILSRLHALDCGHVVTDQEKQQFGIDFGHNRFGDAVFLMKEGCLMHPSHMGRVPWPGMHGFHPNALSSSASLLARRAPGRPVSTVVDMFDVMKSEAGAA